MNPTSRLLAVAFLVLAILVGLLGVLNPQSMANLPRTVADFGIYYSAAKVSQAGGNPFDLPTLHREQQNIRDGLPPMPANSGPWSVGVLMPFTLVPFPAARLMWLLLEIAALITCGDLLWKRYGGRESQVVWVWLVVLGGYASVQTLLLGQLSVLVLVGFVLFVQFHQTRPFLAGLGLSLLIVKPQNQLLAMLIGTLWMIDRRQGKVCTGIVAGAFGLTTLAAIGNPRIFSQYFQLLTNEPPVGYLPPLPGSVLRVWFGLERFWLTFVPLVLGCVWGVAFYRRNRANWDWSEKLPLVLLVSYLASPYGWAYDQLVFLFAYLQVAAIVCSRRAAWWAFLLGVQLLLTGYYFFMLNYSREFHWVWLAPVGTAAYCVWSRCRTEVYTSRGLG
jgi:Glycosyltransferase family 87